MNADYIFLMNKVTEETKFVLILIKRAPLLSYLIVLRNFIH